MEALAPSRISRLTSLALNDVWEWTEYTRKTLSELGNPNVNIRLHVDSATQQYVIRCFENATTFPANFETATAWLLAPLGLISRF